MPMQRFEQRCITLLHQPRPADDDKIDTTEPLLMKAEALANDTFDSITGHSGLD